MKTPDWFVCLDYSSIELLIPQKYVTDYVSKNLSTADLRICSIDKAVQKIITETDISENPESKVLIHTEDFYLALTHARVDIKQIPLSDFSVFKGFLKEQFLKKGILAFRFTEKKLQLIINTDYFLPGGIRF
ncbi:MAG: hypothetical protein J6Z17_06745 [Treponema sp.]|nr:hypothetical protein [Treponema sp.]